MEERSMPGHLVAIPARGAGRPLDGFWAPAARPSRGLTVFVHGMHSNFYRSELRKRWLLDFRRQGRHLLLFNNRGADDGVLDERFSDGRWDILGALQWARRRGYRRFFLAGHSTGCQKIVHYQALERDASVRGLVLLGPADDYALCRRDLGPRYGYWLRRARELKAAGRGAVRLPSCCQGFSARRFLSIADPSEQEARILDYTGRLYHFRRVRVPILAMFGSREEYACRPLAEMGEILAARTGSNDFTFGLVPGTDHGFHGREAEATAAVLDWMNAREARRR